MDIDALVETHFKKNRDIFGFEAITDGRNAGGC